VRRAVEGVGTVADALTDEQMKDLVADAIAEIILYSDSVFGKTLIVTDDEDGIPTEYATSDALTLPEQVVVSAQAALDHFFHRFADMKTAETIADEAQRWEWQKSAQLLRDQFQLLIRRRDEALAQVAGADGSLERYTSFLAVRDGHTAALVEPWVSGHLLSGQEDWRFAGSP
jgi:hypothetical protein